MEEDMSKLRVKEVQRRLDAAGVSYAGIKDKDELVVTYKKAVADALKPADDDDAVGYVLSLEYRNDIISNDMICNHIYMLSIAMISYPTISTCENIVTYEEGGRQRTQTSR